MVDSLEMLRADVVALRESLEKISVRIVDIESSAQLPQRWIPEVGEKYFMAMLVFDGCVLDFNWVGCGFDMYQLAQSNVYRTEAEAKARVDRNNATNITEMLRQLGGGDTGEWVLRLATAQRGVVWDILHTKFFAPGETRFETESAAKAALDSLIKDGILMITETQ